MKIGPFKKRNLATELRDDILARLNYGRLLDRAFKVTGLKGPYFVSVDLRKIPAGERNFLRRLANAPNFPVSGF